jgi:hypothetical protein
MVLEWCYNGVTLALQWCYNSVRMVLEWCYSGGTLDHLSLLESTMSTLVYVCVCACMCMYVCFDYVCAP